MEFSHFVQLIAIGLQARIPMHMTGFPGVGKTEFTKSLEAGFAQAGLTLGEATVHAVCLGHDGRNGIALTVGAGVQDDGGGVPFHTGVLKRDGVAAPFALVRCRASMC